jgi:hypothetical protein
VKRPDAPERVEQKGGPLLRINLRTKLSDPIASRAVTHTEAPRYFGQRLVFYQTGSQGFVTPMPRVRGMEKEIAVSGFVHGSPPCGNSSNYSLPRHPLWRFQQQLFNPKTAYFRAKTRNPTDGPHSENSDNRPFNNGNAMSKMLCSVQKTRQKRMLAPENTHRIMACGNRRSSPGPTYSNPAVKRVMAWRVCRPEASAGLRVIRQSALRARVAMKAGCVVVEQAR